MIFSQEPDVKCSQFHTSISAKRKCGCHFLPSTILVCVMVVFISLCFFWSLGFFNCKRTLLGLQEIPCERLRQIHLKGLLADSPLTNEARTVHSVTKLTVPDVTQLKMSIARLYQPIRQLLRIFLKNLPLVREMYLILFPS